MAIPVSKQQAISVIIDALSDRSQYGCGVVIGLCGGFYMAGILTLEEFESYARYLPCEFRTLHYVAH